MISVTPADHATQVQPESKIVLELSEPLDPSTVSAETVKLLDGEREVPGTVSYADGKITFAPKEPLGLLAVYTVSVSAAVTDLEGAALAEPYASSFSVRDGAWASTDAVTDILYQLSDNLAINARGDAMIAWTDDGSGTYCPPRAQWFRHNVALAAAQTLAAADVSECDSVTAGGNAAGVAAVAWQVPDSAHGTYLQQYRAGKWAKGDGKVSAGTASGKFRVAVSPAGIATLFDNGASVTKAWSTDANGKLAATDTIATSDTALAPQDVAFDAEGNGLSLWRARNSLNQQEILASWRPAMAEKWGKATPLPGSVAVAADANNERGAPAVAFDAQGHAVALWVSETGVGKSALMSSFFSVADGWSDPVSISGKLVAMPVLDRPGLVFDGESFVAAFTAREGTKLGVYTARFDAVSSTWGSYEKRQSAAELASAARMPRLATDSHGNLTLVWATGAAPTFQLVYQRYSAGAWGLTNAIPGGGVDDPSFDVNGAPFPLAMSASGVAALVWGNRNEANQLFDVRIASFF